MGSREFDLIVIGGGIQGAAVARDAAGRGLRVLLAEARDYASATSSASSKLVHGGLRYLEHYEFRLVRESLHERAVLLRTAPHLVSEMRFLFPVTRTSPRPPWMIGLGLKLYDLLSGRSALAGTGRLGREDVAALPRLRKDGLRAVFHYPDCRTDDARLTLEVLLDARARGAEVRNYCPVTALSATDSGFRITLGARAREKEEIVEAPFVVNATGPCVNEVLALFDAASGVVVPQTRPVRLVRGSHIVVAMPEPACPDAYTLQMDDGRVVFVIPWLDSRFLLIGTTDMPHDGSPGEAMCTAEERDYLLTAYNRFFAPPLGQDDVTWTFAGLRALVDEGEREASRVSRDYALATTRHPSGGALVAIYGGKLTTHRILGERVMARLAAEGAQVGPRWTAGAPLPAAAEAAALDRLASGGPASVSAPVRARWARTYGCAAAAIHARIDRDPEGAREIAPGVPEAELLHAVEVEDVREADDYLYRRTKLGLTLPEPAQREIAAWIAGHRPSPEGRRLPEAAATMD